jgi:inhibitor of KinA
MINDFTYTVYPLGDHAVTIELGKVIDAAVNEKVMSLFRHLQQKKRSYIKDIIPAYSSVTIVFDLVGLYQQKAQGSHSMMSVAGELLSDFVPEKNSEKRVMKIPVCYDLLFGIDLQEMAFQKQISVAEIIQLHTSQIYKVYMIGFLPGFAYMGKVPVSLITPRKPQPRKKVEAGSVGIAAEQTGIYPFNSPGGWNIIGRTPLQLFSHDRAEPVLFQPGDEVQFEPIDLNTFHQLKNKV